MQKISGIQILFLMTTFDVGMSLMAMISPTVQKAHQDAWMSIGIATGASMVIAYIGIRLSRLFPNQSFASCLKKVFTPFLGVPLVTLYAVQWIVVTGLAMRQVVDFTMPALQLYDTPFLVVLVCLAVLSAFAGIMGGIESLARCSEVITPLVLAALFFVTLMAFRLRTLSNLLPIVQPHMMQSVISGALPATSFLAQSTILMVIYPYLTDKKSQMAGVWGTGVAGLILMLTTLEVSATFGPNLPAQMWNPFFTLARYISIADFVQNVDAIIVVLWFFSAFIRVALYLWVSAQVTTDLIGVNLRVSLVAISLAALIISAIPPSIIASTIEYPDRIVQPFVLPVLNIGVPALGLLVGIIIKRARAL
jgi:spore germination protein KB